MQGSQGGQTPGSLTSVGNLLTPPSTIAGDGNSPNLSGIPSTSASSSVAPSYAPNNAYAWSPQPQTNHSYGFHPANNAPQQQQAYHHPQQQHRTFSPHQHVVRSSQAQAQESQMASAHYEVNLPPFSNSAPMSAPATLATMGPPQHHHPSPQSHPAHMMGHQAPVSSAGPSPVHAQEAFRPPPTPQYYNHQQPNTPQHHPGFAY